MADAVRWEKALLASLKLQLILYLQKAYLRHLMVRCKCGKCQDMGSQLDNLCCLEPKQIVAVLKDCPSVTCLTQHPGFEAVCLNRYVLQTAYFQYRQQYNVSATETNGYVQHSDHIELLLNIVPMMYI